MKPPFHVWYCYKSGLGIELARVAPLLSALSRKYSVRYASFHTFLYDPRILDLTRLAEMNSPEPELRASEPGIAFVCDARNYGPHRDIGHEFAAEKLGYPTVKENLGFSGLSTYEAAARLASNVCGEIPEGYVSILKKGRKHSKIVLNLFGGAAPEKGFTDDRAISLFAAQISAAFGNRSFIVPVLPHQQRFLSGSRPQHGNIEFKPFRYDDERLTELVAGSPAIVTVEGGLLHLGVALQKPTVCLAEASWLNEVRELLPPRSAYHQILVNFKSEDFAPAVGQLARASVFSLRNP